MSDPNANRPQQNIERVLPGVPHPRRAGAWRALAAGAACVLLGVSGCGRGEAGSGRAPGGERLAVEVTLADVVTRPAERFIEVTGTLYGEEEITVAAEIPGRIVALHADLGDAVEHGAALAEIDPTEYRLAVDEARAAVMASLARLGLAEVPQGEVDLSTLPIVARAEAQAANASARLERARKLYERTPPLISEQDFADIQTQSEVARTEVASERLSARSLLADARVRQSALARAEDRLADCRVIVPAERPLRYRVAARRVSVGEVVADGTPLFRLVASDRVKCRAQVPERFSGQIEPGARALLEMEGAPGPVEATVARVSPAVDIASRSFEIEIKAENAAGLLKPGGFVRGRVLAGIDADARFVPASAVAQFAGVHRVFSVRENAVVEHRVRPGRVLGDEVEVVGLPPEIARVVARPPRGITNGAPVKLAEPAQAPSNTDR